ncbi:mechanosensitive ion channel family protein [Fictibacillus gelatini]|uniref:mechanosensitive ion channel family protein n=1 Tax=Fictibacillus gelatini TaxID=225985 RepID=UPI000406AF8F|nr:mechanosensitive ion channel family protein [Fictibacillus gelatini]
MLHAITNIQYEDLAVSSGIFILKLIVIFIIYSIVKKVGHSIIHTAFNNFAKRNEMSKYRAKTLETLMNSIFAYTLIFIVFVAVFGLFGLDIRGLLAGAGIVGLAIGFGAKDLVSDIVTGFFILLEKQIDVGDYITTGSFSGIVEEVELRTTRVRGFDGTLHYIPNRLITSVSNHSRGNMRALVDIQIPSSPEVENALEIIKEECQKLANKIPHLLEEPKVLVVQSGDSDDLSLRILAKTENLKKWSVENALYDRLKRRLKEEGIEIPEKSSEDHPDVDFEV